MECPGEVKGGGMLSLLGRRVGVGTGRQRRRDDNVCEAVGVVVYKKAILEHSREETEVVGVVSC